MSTAHTQAFCATAPLPLRQRNAACRPSALCAAPQSHCPPARRAAHMSWEPAGLLTEAVALKKLEIATLEESIAERPDHPISLRRSFFAPHTNHALTQSLRRRDGSLGVCVALKRFSPAPPPSRARVVAALDDIVADARAFSSHGVDAAMFFTDALRFGSELAEMRGAARAGLSVPVVRHDLIVDAVQIAEAAEAGASAVVVVAAAALDELGELLDAGTMMGLEVIVECHSTLEVEFAMECGATALLLSNWDRSRNELVKGTAETLVRDVPPWVLKIAGGGLTTARDCWAMLDEGFNAVLLGESLLQSRRPKEFIDEIRSQRRVVGDVFSGDFGIPFADDNNLNDYEG